MMGWPAPNSAARGVEWTHPPQEDGITYCDNERE